MNNTGYRRLQRSLLLAVLLLPLLTLRAQEDPNSPAPDSKEPAAASAKPADPEAAAKDPSPFDYEASEQISEDLSVSFPVDI